jgi:hypothetical protein
LRNKLGVIGLGATLALVIGFAVLQASAQGAPPADKGGMGSCTTDASGYCTVTHGLGTVPGEIQVTGRSPIGGTWTIGQTLADSPTANTFRLRAIAASGAPIAGQPITFWWHVWSVETSSPTTGPEPTVTSPPSTGPEPTVTSPPSTAQPTTTGEPPTSTSPASTDSPITTTTN